MKLFLSILVYVVNDSFVGLQFHYCVLRDDPLVGNGEFIEFVDPFIITSILLFRSRILEMFTFFSLRCTPPLPPQLHLLT